MAKIQESNLWNWLSGARQVLKSTLDMHRVENVVGTGFPDVEGFASPNNPFWIELKALQYPKDPTKPIDHQVTQDQISWLYNRAAVGGKSWVLFQFGSGASHLRLLFPGRSAPKLQEPLTLTDLRDLSVDVSNLTPAEVIRVAANLHSA